MERAYIEQELFERQDFTQSSLKDGEYEGCRFNNCDFSNGSLSGITFIDCMFYDCNLSMTSLLKTVFRDVTFHRCKMLGLRFDTCHPWGLTFRFEECTLNHSSFYQLKVPKTIFKQCTMQEVDLTGCDFTESVLEQCDLANALFDRTILEKADLRYSSNYSIDPENNRIKKAKFSLSGLPGLLGKYQIEIHTAS